MVKEAQEFNDALLGLKHAVVDLKSTVYDTNQKMGKAMTESHIPTALTMFDAAFSFRKTMDLVNPKRNFN